MSGSVIDAMDKRVKKTNKKPCLDVLILSDMLSRKKKQEVTIGMLGIRIAFCKIWRKKNMENVLIEHRL